MSKPSIPQGTRDFSPAEVRKRQYIFNTLRVIFELYGFQPLETPSMENLVTLTGKYGEEGDRLIFKVLNNGLHEKKDADKDKLNSEWNTMLSKPYSSPVVTERALRYDLTIPFARYVVMHQNDLAFPFRRYQMQPVWRADRPQKGRYREFWQCDADVVGSTSLINEAELLCIYQQAFKELNVPVTIKVNSRKLLAALAELCGMPEKMMDITIAMDKLDKIGWIGVANELKERGINDDGIWQIERVINVKGKNDEKLAAFADIMQHSATGMEGINELSKTLAYYKELTPADTKEENIEVDISLARGLNYYTGVIVEVVCSHPDVKMGSIGGGGRYDDLTGLFGVPNLSGVGVSFGIDRIYDVINELDKWPEQLSIGTKVMIVNFGGEDELYSLQLLQQFRSEGIAAEIYPDANKFDKQMKYANKRGLDYVLMAGEQERKRGWIKLKNFLTGEQRLMSIKSAILTLKASKKHFFSNKLINNELFDIINQEINIKDLNTIANKLALTTQLGLWLVKKIYNGEIHNSGPKKEWFIQANGKKMRVKSHSKAETKTDRSSQILLDNLVSIDDLVIIVFSHDYKLKEFYHIPNNVAKDNIREERGRSIIYWDDLISYKNNIDILPNQNIIQYFR